MKLSGKVEKYYENKVFDSVYNSALNSHYSKENAKELAHNVKKNVSKWMKKEKKVFSFEIRDKIVSNIPDEEVVTMYIHHDELC